MLKESKKGIGYARAYNKLEAFAQSLSWEIRLLYRSGEVKIEEDVLRYTADGRCVSLELSPSGVVLHDSTSGEWKVYPMGEDYLLGATGEGIDRAEEDFKDRIRNSELEAVRP